MFDIKKCKLFNNSNIEALKKYIKIHEYNENSLIHLEGEVCNDISIVISGEVEIITYNYDGSSFVISTISEGGLFGEILLYSSFRSYMGSVMSKTKVILGSVSKDKLEELFIIDPSIYHNFINLICDRAFNMNTRLKLIGQKNIRDKINHYINIQQTLGYSKKIPIGKSKEELAKYLNIPRPSLSRELITMKKEGIINFDKKYIYLLAKPACTNKTSFN